MSGQHRGNPWRGEVVLVLNEEAHIMRLTLGALAELEAALQEPCVVSLVARFEEGRFTAQDLGLLVLCALKAGSWKGSAEDLANAKIEGGIKALTQAAAKVIALSFGGGSYAR